MICSLWKYPSTSAGFEPANLGSSDEYDNYWTTGIDVAPAAATTTTAVVATTTTAAAAAAAAADDATTTKIRGS